MEMANTLAYFAYFDMATITISFIVKAQGQNFKLFTLVIYTTTS